jgi:hypothetical protein
MKLYLDDIRPCPKGFTIARTVEEAIDIYQYWNTGRVGEKILSLDHDLGGLDGTYTRTGYDFCKWIIEENHYNPHFYFPDVVYLHTSNPVGRENMLQLLTRYAPSYARIHRSPMPYDFFDGE